MEAIAELLMKLQRRRERMGERSPLRDIDNTPSEPRTKDFDVVVKVSQRRGCFEGSENQAAPSASKPGKLDLGRWEQPLQTENSNLGKGKMWSRPALKDDTQFDENAPHLAVAYSRDWCTTKQEPCFAEQICELQGDVKMDLAVDSPRGSQHSSDCREIASEAEEMAAEIERRMRENIEEGEGRRNQAWAPQMSNCEELRPERRGESNRCELDLRLDVIPDSPRSTLPVRVCEALCEAVVDAAPMIAPWTESPPSCQAEPSDSCKLEIAELRQEATGIRACSPPQPVSPSAGMPVEEESPEDLEGALLGSLSVRAVEETPSPESHKPVQVFVAEWPETLQAESPVAEFQSQAESPALELDLSPPPISSSSSSSEVQPALRTSSVSAGVVSVQDCGASTPGQVDALGGLALGSQATCYDFGRRKGWPGRILGRGSQAMPSQSSDIPTQPLSESPQTLSDGPAVEDFSTQILKPLQNWDGPQERLQSCMYRRLSRGDPASPSKDKFTAASGSTASCATALGKLGGLDPQDGMEPLEYFLLDYAGELPDEVVTKLKTDLEIHEDFVRELWRRNEKLRQRAQRCKDSEAPPPDVDLRTAAEGRRRELLAVGAASRMEAAQEANKRVAAEAYEAAMQARLTRTCRRAEAQIATMTRKAEKTEEESRKKKHVAIVERARTRRESESVGSEIARTEAHLSDLEEAIRNEGQKFRDKEADRKAVAREVEALRCEARAHRARAGKHIRTEQRIEALTRELQAMRDKMASVGGTAPTTPSA
jgi:hypothetical protein